MTIINKSPSKILFEKLSCGEVFKDQRSGICIKIEETIEGKNAAYLTDGLLTYVEEHDEVERVKCQLVIE